MKILPIHQLLIGNNQAKSNFNVKYSSCKINTSNQDTFQKVSFKGSSDFENDDFSILGALDMMGRIISGDTKDAEKKQQDKIKNIFKSVVIENKNLENSPIASLRQIGENNLYSGSMRDTAKNMDKLKELGVKRVVSFCLPSETKIEEACKDNNIDFHYFYVPQGFEFEGTEASKKAIKSNMTGSFAKVVEEIKKGDCIIGCESGNQRTGTMIGILSLILPQPLFKIAEENLPEQSKIFGGIILDKLSTSEKNALGYTKEFIDKMNKKLVNYI